MIYIKKLTKSDQIIHFGFDIGLLLKALNAIAEIIGGIALWFLPPQRLNTIIYYISKGELAQDPDDRFMNYLVGVGHSFGISTWHFMIFYLLSHGIIKLAVIILLWKKKLWAYPLSVLVFSAFAVYQILRFNSTHSVFLILLTILDLIMIALTVLEFRRIKRESKA